MSKATREDLAAYFATRGVLGERASAVVAWLESHVGPLPLPTCTLVRDIFEVGVSYLFLSWNKGDHHADIEVYESSYGWFYMRRSDSSFAGNEDPLLGFPDLLPALRYFKRLATRRRSPTAIRTASKT